MTFGAIDLNVLSGKLESSIVMVEIGCRFPVLFRVAFRAFCVQLTAMLVDMARNAITLQAQKCFGEIDFGLEFFQIFLDEFGLVAILAFGLSMLAFQREACLFVIKIVLPIFPKNHFKRAPCVVGVARKTCFAVDCKDLVMQAALLIDARFDFEMTRETLFGAGATAKLMTLQTVVHAFQMSMRLRELARRYLRPGIGGSEKGQKNKKAIKDNLRFV